jgi:hypothetical protein
MSMGMSHYSLARITTPLEIGLSIRRDLDVIKFLEYTGYVLIVLGVLLLVLAFL